MTKDTDVAVEVLRNKRIEKRKRVAEATGRILKDLNGACVELNCKDQVLEDTSAFVASIMERVIACDDKVTQRATG